MKTETIVLEGFANVGKTHVLLDMINDLRNNINYTDVPNLTINDYKSSKGLSWISEITGKDTFATLENDNKYVIIITAGDSQKCIQWAGNYISWVTNGLRNNNKLNDDSKIIWVTALSRGDGKFSQYGAGDVRWTIA